jgi:hypothetical protein
MDFLVVNCNIKITHPSLAHLDEEDKPIWRLTRDGFYSVKSAYYHAMEDLIDNSCLNIAANWKDMWSLK